MADSQELEPSTSTGNPSNADRQNKPADRKAYFEKINASKVCLNTSIERWKRLKEENEITIHEGSGVCGYSAELVRSIRTSFIDSNAVSM